MLFIFPTTEHRAVLDEEHGDPARYAVRGFRAAKCVGIVANAQPYSEALLGGFDGTLYVLEVNGGYAAQHHIVVGDRLEFHGFSPHTTR